MKPPVEHEREEWLERQTTRGVASEDSSAETNQMRESWDSFARLLDASLPEFDPAATESAVRARIRKQSRRSWRPRTWLLAASIVVGLGLVLLWSRGQGSSEPRQVLDPEIFATRATPERDLPAAEQVQPTPEPARDVNPAFAWDSEIDEAIEDAARSIESLKQSWNVSLAPTEVVQLQLDELESELSDSAL